VIIRGRAHDRSWPACPGHHGRMCYLIPWPPRTRFSASP
jgi:hypothetical protein